MAAPAFKESELKVVGMAPQRRGDPVPMYDYPVTMRENIERFYKKDPVWEPTGIETQMMTPWIIADNKARAFVFDGTTVPGVSNLEGGKDMFGLDWTFVPEVGGSITAPGNPSFDDANDLVDGIEWPNIEDWDWAKCKADNAEFVDKIQDKAFEFMFLTGWFERLIAFMDFEGAIVALIDEDQQEGVHKFFDKLTDFYIGIFDKVMETWPTINFFCIHDDWGSQKDTFFAPELAKEMIVPYMKRATDHLHERGMICDLHSCGQNFKQVPNYIEAGWDSWTPQMMNDTHKMYEEYGEDIILGVMPNAFDAETASEAEQRESADAFVDQFCNGKKLAAVNTYAGMNNLLTPAFREELYIASRKKFSGQ